MSQELAQARRELEKARKRWLARNYEAAALVLEKALKGSKR